MGEERYIRLLDGGCLFKSEDRRKDADQKKTYDEVFDHRTLKCLYKLMTDRVFKSVDCPVSTGKEGNVFRATDWNGGHLAVKIYRTSNASFKNILPYIEGDPRFKGFRRSKVRLFSAWAAKEFRNLKRMHEAGMSVPRPLVQRDCVIVMEFIGEDGMPYPLLKDVQMDDPAAVLDEIARDYGKGYSTAGLVHGDLSEYNVMMGDGPRIIDVAQATLLSNPFSIELFERDVSNLTRFFTKKGLTVDCDMLGKMMKGDT